MAFLLHAQKCAEVKIFAINPSPRTGDALLQDRRERIRKVRLVVFHPTPRCARIFLSRASTGIALDGQKELIALTPKRRGFQSRRSAYTLRMAKRREDACALRKLPRNELSAAMDFARSA